MHIFVRTLNSIVKWSAAIWIRNMAVHKPQTHVAARQCAVTHRFRNTLFQILKWSSQERLRLLQGDGLAAVDRGGGQTQVARSSETRREAGSDPEWPRLFTCCAPPHQLRVKALLEEHKPGHHCFRRYSRHNGRSRQMLRVSWSHKFILQFRSHRSVHGSLVATAATSESRECAVFLFVFMFPVYTLKYSVCLMFYYFMCFDCAANLDESTLPNLLLRGCKG